MTSKALKTKYAMQRKKWFEETSASSEPRFGEGNWTLKQLQELIQTKITERTARATVEKQDAYKLFGRPADGITPRIFRRQLRKWGIVLSSRHTDAVFSHFDVTGSGTITFQELASKLMTKDYSGKTWNVVIDERNDALLARKEKKTMVSNAPALSLSEVKLAQLSKMLQTKILERTKNGNTEIGDAYKLFGRPHNGITKELFKTLLEKVGMYLPSGELDCFYKSFDKNNSGTLTFQEFISGVMPKDFTEKSWNVKIDERNEAIQREKEKKHRSSHHRHHRRRKVDKHKIELKSDTSTTGFSLEAISISPIKVPNSERKSIVSSRQKSSTSFQTISIPKLSI